MITVRTMNTRPVTITAPEYARCVFWLPGTSVNLSRSLTKMTFPHIRPRFIITAWMLPSSPCSIGSSVMRGTME